MKFLYFLIIVKLMLSPVSAFGWAKLEDIYGEKRKVSILTTQQPKERKYFKSPPVLKNKISLEGDGDNLLYKPNFCCFDDYGSIYTLDYSTYMIHKFSPIPGTNKYKHIYFGKEKGQGPGELMHPLDMKIHNKYIYFADVDKGCIVEYDIDGNFLKDIRLSDQIRPAKLIISDNNFIVEPRLELSQLFHVYDLKGRLRTKFGKYIDPKHKHDGVYHDNYIIKYKDDKFFYIPLYLGIMGMYSNRTLINKKETIDGLKIVKTIHKEVLKDTWVRKIEKKYITANAVGCNGEFLLIISIELNKKKNKWFCDLYAASNMHYLGSIKNVATSYLSLRGDLISFISGTYLYIYDLSNIYKEAKANPQYE